jgi:superfamily II DNA or RNA helicase
LLEVSFELSPAELDLSDTARALSRIFEDGTPQQGWIGKALRRRLESSPAAIERALQRFVEGSELVGTSALPVVPEEEINEDDPVAHIDLSANDPTVAIARRALQTMDAIGVDSKLNTLNELLSCLHEPRRVCILTEYLATLYYLSAEMEGQRIAYQLLHGAIPIEEREGALRTFRSEGKILLATRPAVSEGIDLNDVTNLVFYDLPDSKHALHQALGRFDRFGRISELMIYVLTPSNRCGELVTESLAILRGLLDPPNAAPQHR